MVVAATAGVDSGELEADGGRGDGGLVEGDSYGFKHFWGVLPTFPALEEERGRRVSGGGVEAQMTLVDRDHSRSLQATMGSPGDENWLQGGGRGGELQLEEAGVDRKAYGVEVEGRSRSEKLPRGSRRLAEDCSSSCLRSTTQRCFNDPGCEGGGLGCNALNDQLCRFCGFSDFVDCGTGLGPTPAPIPTPSPTSPPDRQVCASSCLEATYFTCFDDSTCRIGGLGCNARGDFFCRFCGFGEFITCPDGVGATVVPTPAPSLGLTVAPSLNTLTPTFAPLFTPSPSLVPTMAPSSIAPTMAPSSIAPTLVPTAVPTTMAPLTLVPTLAPTAIPTTVVVGPTMAPTGAPTASNRDVSVLGPSSVIGVISVMGVSDELVEDKGEEALIQEVRGVGLGLVYASEKGG